jgi:fructokinase
MRIGIDLGGTKIEAVALDDCGEELFRKRVATPRDDYAATVEAVAALAEDAESATSSSGTVGIGVPGTISPATGVMKNANSTCLIGKPLREDLEARLGREVRLANDANCFALSEATDGAAAGADIVFGVIVGTGVGSGIVAHGRVLVGVNAVAGEWGHNPLPRMRDDERPGARCYCGRDGCLETWISGTAMARDHRDHGGEDLASDEIARRAGEGDAACAATLGRYVDRMARGLASIVNVLDPDVIVLGGGMSNVTVLYDRVPELWGAHVFSDRVDTRLVPPRFGDSSGVRGAAWLWPG